jgi:sRNA-binding regulator protein Hfq
MTNRKLIRPSIKDVRDNIGRNPNPNPTPSLPPSTPAALPSGSGGGAVATRRKQIPAEQTNAEIFYYYKQMQTRTPVVITLLDGEQIRGVIEWYDRHALKVNRSKEPNLLILKHNIKYIYKQDEETKSHRRRKKPGVVTEED